MLPLGVGGNSSWRCPSVFARCAVARVLTLEGQQVALVFLLVVQYEAIALRRAESATVDCTVERFVAHVILPMAGEMGLLRE